jgi:hypothetical protein
VEPLERWETERMHWSRASLPTNMKEEPAEQEGPEEAATDAVATTRPGSLKDRQGRMLPLRCLQLPEHSIDIPNYCGSAR